MKHVSVLLLALYALLFGATSASAQTGQFDPSYGLNGKSPLPDPGGSAYPLAKMAMHGLSDIVVAGSNDDDMIFAYRLPFILNGESDPNFGVGGLAVWPEQYPGVKEIYLALAGPGQKTLAVYNEFAYLGAADFDHTRLCMFDVKGNPDLSFGNKGTLVLDLAPGIQEEYLYKGFIAPDGKIILCGLVYLNDDAQGIVIRLNPDGSFDNTFNGSGIYILPESIGPSALATMALMPNGKIIAGGVILNPPMDQTAPVLIRLNPDGTPDAQFGNSGILHMTFAADVVIYVSDIIHFPNGQMLIVGAHPDFTASTLMALKANGALDNNAFGGEGYALVPLPDGSDFVELPRLAHAEYLRVFVLNSYYVFDESVFGFYPAYQLAAVNLGQFPDPGFGDNGFKEVNDLGLGVDIAVDETGRIYVCSTDWEESLIYVSRFLGYPTSATHAPAWLTELSVAPNPASEQIGLRLSLPEAENLQIALIGPDGRLCERLAPLRWYAQGEHMLQFPLNGGYAPGAYRIVVSAANGRSSVATVSIVR